MNYAYAQGSQDAKIAFSVNEFLHGMKGHIGPILSGLFTGHPLTGAAAGMVGSIADTPRGGSNILRSSGVGLGSLGAHLLVSPVAGFIADAVVGTLLPGRGHTVAGPLLRAVLHGVPTGMAQEFAASKGRGAAIHVEKFLKKKDVRIP